MRLYDYWRSSASYRVRIGLELKGLSAQRVGVDLKGAAHREADYLGVNAQGLVPTLEVDEGQLSQSLAILEYLDEVYPQRRLLARDPWTRAQQRAMAMVVACDVHPLCNLRVLNALREEGTGEAELHGWMSKWMHAGFAALERMAGGGPFLGGEIPMLPDLVLVPQMYNARRFEVSLEAFPTLVSIAERCEAMPAFQRATPRQAG